MKDYLCIHLNNCGLRESCNGITNSCGAYENWKKLNPFKDKFKDYGESGSYDRIYMSKSKRIREKDRRRL